MAARMTAMMCVMLAVVFCCSVASAAVPAKMLALGTPVCNGNPYRQENTFSLRMASVDVCAKLSITLVDIDAPYYRVNSLNSTVSFQCSSSDCSDCLSNSPLNYGQCYTFVKGHAYLSLARFEDGNRNATLFPNSTTCPTVYADQQTNAASIPVTYGVCTSTSSTSMSTRFIAAAINTADVRGEVGRFMVTYNCDVFCQNCEGHMMANYHQCVKMEDHSSLVIGHDGDDPKIDLTGFWAWFVANVVLAVFVVFLLPICLCCCCLLGCIFLCVHMSRRRQTRYMVINNTSGMPTSV